MYSLCNYALVNRSRITSATVGFIKQFETGFYRWKNFRAFRQPDPTAYYIVYDRFSWDQSRRGWAVLFSYFIHKLKITAIWFGQYHLVQEFIGRKIHGFKFLSTWLEFNLKKDSKKNLWIGDHKSCKTKKIIRMNLENVICLGNFV